jgi:sugar diacid utilization regulator/putative methionine-R-sulfoxide reductase with GAF domain
MLASVPDRSGHVDDAVLVRALNAISAIARADDVDRIVELLAASVRTLVPGTGVSVEPHGDGAPDPATSVFPFDAPGGPAAVVLDVPAASLPLAQSALIDLLCMNASLAVALARASAATERTEALFETLAELSEYSSDAPRLLQTVVRRTAALLGMDAAWVMLADEPKAHLTLEAAFGITSPAFADMSIDIGDLMPGIAIKRRRVVCLRDASADERSRYSRPEGLRTVMCAPMFVEDQLVGVLVAAHREIREPSPEDRHVMATLAGAVAVSIANARLYGQGREHARALEASMAFERRLTELVLGGAGLDEVVRTVADALDCAVLVLNRDLGVLQCSPPDACIAPQTLAAVVGACEDGIAEAEAGDLRFVVAPLEVACHQPAYVVFAGGRGPSSGMAEAAVTALGLELMRDRATAEAEARLTGGLFHALMSREAEDETIARRASYLGYELAGANVVIAARGCAGPSGDEVELQARLQRAVRHRGKKGAAVFCDDDATFVVLSEPDEVSPALIREYCRRIARELEAFPDVRIAHAGPHLGIAGVRRAAEEAAHALRVLDVLGKRGTPTAFRDLGAWALLGGIGDQGRLRAFADEVLGVLVEHDATRRGHLVDTVRALVQSNFQIRPAAERLFVHPNTLRYRIARISELTGLDPASPDDRFTAEMALRVLDVLEA